MEPVPLSAIPKIFSPDLAALLMDSRCEALRHQTLADDVARLEERLKKQAPRQNKTGDGGGTNVLLLQLLSEALPVNSLLWTDHNYWSHILEYALKYDYVRQPHINLLDYFRWFRQILDMAVTTTPVEPQFIHSAHDSWHLSITARQQEPATRETAVRFALAQKTWFETLTGVFSNLPDVRDCLGYPAFFTQWADIPIPVLHLQTDAAQQRIMKDFTLYLAQFFREFRLLVDARFPGKWPAFTGRSSRGWFMNWLWQNRNSFVLSYEVEIFRHDYRLIDDIPLEQAFEWLPPVVAWNLEDCLAESDGRYAPVILHLASGGSLRTTSGLPFRPGSRMAHTFQQCNNVRSISEALMYAQVLAMGGNKTLFEKISRRRNDDFKDNVFWESVIRWYVKHKEDERLDHDPGLLDYIRHQRERQGERFTMKGRTVTALLRQSDEWHGRFETDIDDGEFLDWPAWDIPEFWPKLQGDEPVFLRIVQLTDSDQMAEESQAMCHCVDSYTRQCFEGQISIWSLRSYAEDEQLLERHATIEVSRQRRIVQVRARGNSLPEQHHLNVIKTWGEANGLEFVSC